MSREKSIFSAKTREKQGSFFITPFVCGAGFRHSGGDQRALRSPSGLLRLPHLSILAVIAAFLVSTPFVLLSNDKNQETWECSAKVSKGRPQTSFVFMPFGRVRRREALCNKNNQVTSKAKITKKAQRKPPAFAHLRKQTASKVKSGECNYSRISRRSALT